MKQRQIINISSTNSTLSNVITVTVEEFLKGNFKNSFILIDRTFVSDKEILDIKTHCRESGINPFIDNSYMEASYIYAPDWQATSDEGCYDKPLIEAIQYLEEAEVERKLYELEDASLVSKTAAKLVNLAKDSAASFGEKRNAVAVAYNIVFGKSHTIA